MSVCRPFLLLRLRVKSHLEGDLPDTHVRLRQHKLSVRWQDEVLNLACSGRFGVRGSQLLPPLSLLLYQGPSRQPWQQSVFQR